MQVHDNHAQPIRRLTMKLYYAPGACSLAPHIALREAGLSFDLDRVTFPAKKTQDGSNFLSINPKGAVPALALEDGGVLTEAAVILQYIADRAPAKELAPAVGTVPRYRLQEWLNYIATELHKGFGPLWKPNTPESYKTIVKDNLGGQFAYVEKNLGKGGYLMGDTFTVADAYLFTIVNWTSFHNIDLGPYPQLKAYLERVAARPKVREALQAEGLAKAA
jgi:glutathione S-transferase